jgi:hypothetical protein
MEFYEDSEYYIDILSFNFFFKQYFIHIQSEWDQAAGLAYFSPLPNIEFYVSRLSFNCKD